MKAHAHPQHGLSLIELMVALLLSGLLLVGLVQIFSASRASYQMAQGLARVQETSRFAIDYLQRDARMAGQFGCVNDQVHIYAGHGMFGELFLSDRTNYTTLPNVLNKEALNFDFSIQGFEAKGSASGDTVDLSATELPNGAAADWSPALPTSMLNLVPKPIKGSDVLALRYLSAESADILNFNLPGEGGPNATINVNPDQWPVLKKDLDKGGLFGLADCRQVVIFHATQVTEGATATTLTVAPTGVNQSTFDGSDTFAPGQARIYRADSFVYYVGLNAQKLPSLYRARYNVEPNTDKIVLAGGESEQLVDGVENLQLMYGQDSVTDAGKSPIGLIESVLPGDKLVPAGDQRTAWQRVGSLQVGLLVSSSDPATAAQRVVSPQSLGVKFKLPNDGRFRTSYETSIALRNRLYGN